MSRRLNRVADAIKDEIAAMLVRDVQDPRIGLVTLTRVTVSPDLRHARVHFSVMGGEKEQSRTLAGLRSASGFFRGELGKRLNLRAAPELQFEFDDVFEEAERVARLLRDVIPEKEEP